MNTYLLPSLSFFPSSFETAARIVRAAGYDGLEQFFFRHFWRYPRIGTYQKIAEDIGIRLSFHETWPWGADPAYPSVSIPAAWGGLLPKGATLIEQFGDTEVPIVAYPHHFDERDLPQNSWWQTYAYMPGGKFNVSFETFMNTVRERQLPIVLDTQHWLEYQNGRPGIEHLNGVSRENLTSRLIQGFNSLRSNIREIHLNNFDPVSGRRNTLPWEGVLDLREFCRHVVSTGWSGPISIEVDPFMFFRRLGFQKKTYLAASILERVREWWQ